MNYTNIALLLRALADEFDAAEESYKPPPAIRAYQQPDYEDEDGSPAELLNQLNDKGFPLIQCLRNMLKKWDERDPNWKVEGGLARQAKLFGVSPMELHAAIRTNSGLSRRFMNYPASGYRG